MLLMIIITLITLSFASISRREQRQALDRQLSTQAFYAAETGINDASEAIENGMTSDITTCDAAQQALINPSGGTGTLDAASNTIRTCVFVDQTPLQIDAIVGEDESKIYKISAGAFTQLRIYWENDDLSQSQVFPPTLNLSTGAFPPDASWNGNTRPGVVMAQLTPATFPTDRTAVANGMVSVYGYPTANSGNTTRFGSDPNGEVLTGSCNVNNTSTPNNWPRQCRIIIDNLSGEYYLKLLAAYDPVHVTVEAWNGTGGQFPFAGAQVQIDSTGRANDVVRRIKVFKPLRSSPDVPDYVLDIGDDLCKRLETEPANTTVSNPSGIASCNISYP